MGRSLGNFDELLHRPGAVGIFAEFHWLGSHGFNDLRQLALACVFGQLLHQIVSETVVHQVPELAAGAIEYLVEDLLVLLLSDVLLEQTTASLILGQDRAILKQL